MSRETPEWIGKTDDTPIPRRVKLRVLEKYQSKCGISGRPITPSDRVEFDHIIARAVVALVLVDVVKVLLRHAEPGVELDYGLQDEIAAIRALGVQS